MNRKTLISSLPSFGSKKFGAVPKPTKAVKIVQAKPKALKRQRIAPMSEKKKVENRKYLVLRIDFLNKYKVCQIGQNGCKGKSTEVHHGYDGADRSKYYLDVSTWFAACQVCHRWVHTKPLQAKELGFLK